MKKLTCILLGAMAFAVASLSAQPTPLPPAGYAPAPPARPLTKFNLDFPGGVPRDLVAAIQKATGRPLNVVVPVEFAEWKLPPLKMNAIDIAQLFRAMEQAGRTIGVVPTGNGSFQRTDVMYGFRTTDTNPSTQTDDTIWYFYVNGEQPRPKISRFYYLKPYLDGGLSVDDITTAIQTGWKMRGDAEVPALSFHKETKLLIAVGDWNGLDTIEAVLKVLEAAKPKPAADKAADDKKTKP